MCKWWVEYVCSMLLNCTPMVRLIGVLDFEGFLQLFISVCCLLIQSVFMRSFILKLLQDFTPEEGKYDLIWCQWVLGHLTDGEMYTPSGHQCPYVKKNNLCILQTILLPSFSVVSRVCLLGED